jgi:hypothetical protein
VRGREAPRTLHPQVCVSCLPRGHSVLCGPMDGATSPAPGDELELSVLEGQPDEQTPLSEVLQVLPSPDEQTPLNGALQVLPSSAQNPCTAEVRSPGAGRFALVARSHGRSLAPVEFWVPSQLFARPRPRTRVLCAGIF